MAELILPDCVACGKSISKSSFIKSGRKREACSRRCSLVLRAMRALERNTKLCDNCGDPYSAKSVEKSRFCGNSCSRAWKKAAPRNCKYCDVLFSPVRMLKSGNRFISDGANKREFCSRDCLVSSQREGRDKSCIECGIRFTPIRKDSKTGFFVPYDLPTTCSTNCREKAYPVTNDRRLAVSKRMTKELHPNWQGGSHRCGFRGHNWKAIAERIRDGSGRKCEHCGKSELENGRKLDVNRKVPFHQFKRKELANRIKNLEALCRSCHQKADWIWRTKNPVQFSMSI